MERVVLIAVAVLVAAAVGFALGRATDDTTTIHRTKKVIVREPPSGTDRLRKQFGIPTEVESCEKFGLPEEVCGSFR